PEVLDKTRAEFVCLMNLSRDQMDRSAEIWLLAKKWRTAVQGSSTHVIANCDDPLVTWGASSADRVTWVAAGQRWKEDSWCCPECGGPLDRKDADWACRECPLRRPQPQWVLDGDAVIDPYGQRWPLRIQLPGLANRANAAMALAVAALYGVSPDRALPRLAEVKSVAGRYTMVERNGRQARLLLAKNPAGWLEAFDVTDPSLPVILSVNAQVPDG